MEISTALAIKPYWGNKILDGDKTIELRGKNTKKRGHIALAFSGTGLLHGTVKIVDSYPVDRQWLENNRDKHAVHDLAKHRKERLPLEPQRIAVDLPYELLLRKRAIILGEHHGGRVVLALRESPCCDFFFFFFFFFFLLISFHLLQAIQKHESRAIMGCARKLIGR